MMRARRGATWVFALVCGLTFSAAGETLRDCDDCPVMVVVPEGTFTMGAAPNERGRHPAERPQHEVAVEAFAAGMCEVTRREWNTCAASGPCRSVPTGEGADRDDDPIAGASWLDAQDYVAWLRHRTGKAYRLLSEAEWEYAARAGSQTAYWWGEDGGTGHANCYHCLEQAKLTILPCGSFEPNAFGLYDTAGNVSEWVEDCWHHNYDRAPADGAPWTIEGNCKVRVARGGNYLDDRIHLGSARRGAFEPDVEFTNVGFRVARDLN